MLRFANERESFADAVSHDTGVLDIGEGKVSTPHQSSDFFRINFILFGFATMNGFHIKCMPQDKFDIFLFA